MLGGREVSVDWGSYIGGVVSAAILIPIVQWTSRKIVERFKSTIAIIEILEPISAISYGLLHVCNGLPERNGSLNTLNQELAFIEEGNSMVVKVRYPKGLGFEFKCFVDHPGRAFEDVQKELLEKGFKEITCGGGKKDRAWFLLENFPVVQSGPNRNNLYYPS